MDYGEGRIGNNFPQLKRKLTVETYYFMVKRRGKKKGLMIPVLESVEFYRYTRSLQAHVLTGKSFSEKRRSSF